MLALKSVAFLIGLTTHLHHNFLQHPMFHLPEASIICNNTFKSNFEAIILAVKAVDCLRVTNTEDVPPLFQHAATRIKPVKYALQIKHCMLSIRTYTVMHNICTLNIVLFVNLLQQ